jgi:putative hydrolase of the HAD superfamily
MQTSTWNREARCVLLDWGDTVMRVFPEYEGPMFAWPRVEAVEGIREALVKLQPDWTIALATNAADSEEQEIWSALARVGLDRLIDRVFCYRGVGHRKSAPEYFERVLADLGIEANHAVMVGDDFEADVLSANRSGIRAIWFAENGTNKKTSEMHRTIHGLHELPEALELLLKWLGWHP